LTEGFQHEYGLDILSRCPYQGNRWERERRIRALVNLFLYRRQVL
jgi:hypothetical protein